MSRIGKLPIPIPKGVEVKIEGNKVTVQGPLGTLEREFHPDMIIKREGDEIRVERPTDSRFHKSLHGLTRTLINNMIIGVTQGYKKELEIIGMGYKAQLQGKKLILNVGYSHPVEIEPLPGVEIKLDSPTRVVVSGIDKEKVGEQAAIIRRVRPPEPYKGTGIRYAGEYIRRKAGKTGV